MRSQRATSLAELNWLLVGIVCVIALLGVYNLHSAAAAREPGLYTTQIYWFLIGVGLAALILLPDYRVTEGLAYPFYAVVCLLLLAVLLQGKTAGGAQRWLEIGPVVFQPSELAKLATVFCLARYFGHRSTTDGYTMASLFRPLNLSRPLACIAVLAVFWSNPWLVDPVGELARFIRATLGNKTPATADLLWFKFLLITAVLGSCALAVWFVIRLQREQALLNPWQPGRRSRIIALVVALGLALLLLLLYSWHHPILSDPFGVAIAHLAKGAGTNGPYAVLRAGFALRAVLTLAAAVYLVVSLLSLPRAGDTVDLVIAPIDLVAAPALLVLVEPDLGTAGIIILVGMSMIFVVGVRLRSLIILGLTGALVATVAWFGILKDYQKRRILTFLDPEHDIKGAGWNAVQSMIAVGSGRWWGKGHKGGTQTQLSFLPEQHTDFAFSVWAEEQGFLGCLILIGLYALLLAIAFAVAADARERYGALLVTGVASIILWQTLINIGMVIGVFPVVGLTLPLFSYGGSSLLTVVIGIGLILNVHWRRRAH